MFGEKKAECVPWGTGKGDIFGILEELHRQKFRGIFGIEYEPEPPQPSLQEYRRGRAQEVIRSRWPMRRRNS